MSIGTGAESRIMYSIAPWLTVWNGAQAVAFYKAAFGAIEVYHLEDPTGAVVSRLSVEGAEFWLSGGTSDQDDANYEAQHGGPVRMILTVPDPDVIFAKALAAGAREIFPVSFRHGWRLGRVVDPYGHHWEIGHPLAS